jgi:WD40 repeat protein
METGACVHVLRGHTLGVNDVSISHDGKMAVTGSGDSTGRVWNLDTGECARVLLGHTRYINAVAMSADGKTAVTGSLDKTARVWNLDTGECIRVLEEHSGEVVVAISSDRNTVVSGSNSTMPRVWDVETGTCVRELAHEDVRDVAMSPDGSTVVTMSLVEATAWDVGTGLPAVVREWGTSVPPTRLDRCLRASSRAGVGATLDERGHAHRRGAGTLAWITEDERLCVWFEWAPWGM